MVAHQPIFAKLLPLGTSAIARNNRGNKRDRSTAPYERDFLMVM